MRRSRHRPATGASVQVDWCGWLPEAKLQAYRAYSEEFESYYNMLSVSLDEAIALRESGFHKQSAQIVNVAPALCARLTDRLRALLSSLDEHAKHYGVVPCVEPLNAENFRGERGQSSARVSSMLSLILFSRRAQFLSKITSLHNMVIDLAKDFRVAAEDLAQGEVLDRPMLWTALVQGHFDLNTCLCECIILLKCFLRVLPDDQLLSFQKTVAAQSTPRRPALARSIIRHRRMHQFAGE